MNKQITYSGMIWLLAAQLVVMLPLAWHLPAWLVPVMLIAAGWRLRVLKGGLTQPDHILKMLLVLLGIGGLLLSGLRFPSLEAMSSLLMLGFAFKSLEVVERRDALVVIFIGYFLVALNFLYAQSMLAALYGAFALVVLTGALIGVQQAIAAFSTTKAVSFNLRLSVFMLLQSLPLMLGIFMLAPRLQPLWTLPVMTEQAKSGISDRMAPGDIENLSKSGELAFRVTFKNPAKRPLQSQLYWRGLVLNHFDGREWRQFETQYESQYIKGMLNQQYRFRPDKLLIGGEPFEYEAIYEKTGQPWLFTLTPSVEVKGDVLMAADYRVMANEPLQAPLMLKATAYPHAALDRELDPYIRQLALQLPDNGNQRSLNLAQRLHEQTGNNEEAYIKAVQDYFHQQMFVYTLRPPAMGEIDSIDTFLFDKQHGFCAHYAGSFVFLMRAAGIPARVVIGYQGGEWNEQNQYLAVHQYDAHAWAEVWLPGKGWVQIDPTTWVAPERTEQGLEAAVKAEGSFMEGQMFNVRQVPWLNGLRQKFDALQYGWQRWVLGYDSDAQRQLFKALLGEISITRMALMAAGVFATIVLLWMVVLGLTRPRITEALEHQLYRRFCAQLAKKGVVRMPGQAPGVFAVQASQALPAQAHAIGEFTRLYEELCYSSATDSDKATRRLKTLLNQFR